MRRLTRLTSLSILLPLSGCLAGLSVRTPSLPHVVVHEGRYFVTGLGMRHGLRQGDSLWIQGSGDCRELRCGGRWRWAWRWWRT